MIDSSIAIFRMGRLTTPAKWVLFAALLLWMSAGLVQRIDLTTADAGRHITNGAMILKSGSDRQGVLYTNFYSYTMPGQPFINHHWLTGVLFFVVWKVSGFAGLSVLVVVAGLAGFALFWDVARRAGGYWLAMAAGLLTAPLVTLRFDIRPEAITTLLMGVFLWILWRVRAKEIESRWLYSLPVLMLLWVNLHIGFVFGFLVLGAFLLDAAIPLLWIRVRPRPAIAKSKSSRTSAPEIPAPDAAAWKPLARVFGLCILAGLLNPNFVKGFLYPLFIFDNYGYRIVENQSIPVLEQFGLGAVMPFVLLEFTAASLLLIAVLAGIVSRKFDRALLIPALISTVMAWSALRNFAIFGLFAVPALAGTIHLLRIRKQILIPIVLVVLAIAVRQQIEDFSQYFPTIGFGLLPGVEASADFLRANHLSGPIFNDYDIGGYLIFKLVMDGWSRPVFVDNRPEAYTTEFFQTVYKPAQQDESEWRRLDARYHFNVIFFSRRDATSWAKTFLENRSKDGAWAAVFADPYNIIFLRRENPANTLIIQKFAR
ncbi:MAG TPA: hypothetical protein VKU19_01420 [Bryobacteraceae bacterium]|nr:hypothetical protein [Bryobacteraceae bacterium]